MREPAGPSRPKTSPFLLIGGDVVVRLNDVVAILDQHACEAAPTREFLGFCRRRGQAMDLTGGEPLKAAVICRERVFLSAFSSATLRRRTTGGAFA